MSKIMMIAAGAAGYVLGARAGRERYEQIAQQAQKVWSNPKVAQKRQEAKEAAMAQAPVVKEKLQGAASSVTDRGASTPSASSTSSTVTSPTGSPTTTATDQSMSQESTPAATHPVV